MTKIIVNNKIMTKDNDNIKEIGSLKAIPEAKSVIPGQTAGLCKKNHFPTVCI